jgi:hypothetical protein
MAEKEIEKREKREEKRDEFQPFLLSSRTMEQFWVSL